MAELVLAAVGGVDVLTRASFAIKRLVHDWKDAPRQVAVLSEEITNCRKSLLELKGFCENLESSSTPSPINTVYVTVLGNLMRDAGSLWTELDNIVQSLKEPTGEIKNQKWIKKAHSVTAIREKLRLHRLAILEILSVYTAASSIRIESAVATYRNDQQIWFDSTTQSLSDILLRLENLNPPRNGPNSPPDHESAEGQDDENSITNAIAPDHSGTRAWASICCLDRPELRCPLSCTCRCHFGRQNGRIRIDPSAGILGSISLAYSGWAFAGPRCSMISCRRAQLKLLEFTFCVPSYLTNISITASISLTSSGLALYCSVKRLSRHGPYVEIPDIVKFSGSGLVFDVQRCLKAHPDSIRDVTWPSGIPAIRCALQKGHLNVARILIAAGADPFQEDNNGSPAIYPWFLRMYRGQCNQQEEDDVNQFLPISASLEEFGLSHIHKVVLRIRPLDLQAQLNKTQYRSQLNIQDAMGNTPLHWAATRKGLTEMNILLASGARVNVRNKWGRTAIFDACSSNFEVGVQRLISFGALLNVRDKMNRTLINAAALGNADRSLLSFLISMGLDMNDSDTTKLSPLMDAVENDRANCVEVLLDMGADIECEHEDSDTVLFSAIAKCSPNSLKVLLSSKANFLHKNAYGHTILHAAAMGADKETFESLAAADLNGLDVNAKDKNLMTAREYFTLRSGLPDDTKLAFEMLMDILTRVDESVTAASSDGEEFVDALEDVPV